jgi:hypothetical protein
MADSALFNAVCDALVGATSFDRLEARGTIRLALKASGLDTATVTNTQMRVVIDRVLPDELTARGIVDVQAVSRRLDAVVTSTASEAIASDSPEAIFQRLGGEPRI